MHGRYKERRKQKKKTKEDRQAGKKEKNKLTVDAKREGAYGHLTPGSMGDVVNMATSTWL
jgi:hypothetical protein